MSNDNSSTFVKRILVIDSIKILYEHESVNRYQIMLPNTYVEKNNFFEVNNFFLIFILRSFIAVDVDYEE